MKLYWLSFVLCLILTPVVRQIAIKCKLLDQPSGDRWHKKPVALLGGVAIYLSAAIPFLLMDKNYLMSICIVGMIALFTLGLFDDFMYIKPYIKLLVQVLVSVYVISSGIHFQWFNSFILNALISMVWIVGVTNAFNLIDNMDGLCTGVGVIACFFFSIVYLGEGLVLCYVLGGSLSAFLIYNTKPASIFMGDCGSLFIGFLLAVLGMYFPMEFGTGFGRTDLLVLLVLAVPIIDTTFVTFRRMLDKRSVFIGGRDHLSHMLVSMGFSEMFSVLILYMCVIIFGLIGMMFL